MSPSWSPDGRHLAFQSNRDGDVRINWEIYVMGADGANPRNLTNHLAYDDSPSWSPDGRHLAFMSYRDGNSEIYVMGADGANPRRLTNHSASDVSPSWSPDGRHLAFMSYRDGNFEIYVMELREQGGDDVDLVMAPGESRRHTESFSADFSYSLSTEQLSYQIASSDIDDGLLGLSEADVEVAISYSVHVGLLYVSEVTFSYNNLRVSPEVPLNTTLRATIVYRLVTETVSFDIFNPSVVTVGIYTVSLVVFVSNNGGSSAKVIAGDAESPEQIRVQRSSSASSALINRQRSVEQLQGGA